MAGVCRRAAAATLIETQILCMRRQNAPLLPALRTNQIAGFVTVPSKKKMKLCMYERTTEFLNFLPDT